MAGEPIKLLLIEDEQAHVKLIERALDRSNLNVTLTHVTSGAEALSVLQGERFDLALFDYSLSGQTGLENRNTLAASLRGKRIDRLVVGDGPQRKRQTRCDDRKTQEGQMLLATADHNCSPLPTTNFDFPSFNRTRHRKQ